MSLGSVNPLVPTHTHNQRGATTSSGDVVLPPPVGAPTTTRRTQHRDSGSWGATPEKMALLDVGCITHGRTNDFEAYVLVSTATPDAFAVLSVAPPGSKFASPSSLTIIATETDSLKGKEDLLWSYKGPEALGWPYLLGSVVDLKYWGRFLRARNYECDFLFDEIIDPSSRPTKDVILRYLQSLASCANPGDEIVLVCHGHQSGYIPLNCPLNPSGKADFRGSFLDELPSGAAVLVIWDACEASNPFGLSQSLELEDGRFIFEPTVDPSKPAVVPKADSEPSVVVICASSGKNFEVELSRKPEKVQCGPLCWAAFTFVFHHLQDSIQAGAILQALMGHIRFCFEDREDVIPQAAPGPDIPAEVLELLATLFAAHH
ncbi:hypothetical protein M407DRAFT_22006 [Tulasnella calospora MUT 4182]|uniref:Uncharacterized protein n=1 Tax=Tulasnella calospora MUT 4182 TaxID=1051891 RepID=A0A0C3M5L1_9AGAM|nr:hypothetical protein M407DRAFT_22006 [Tulasnella calospora MUT 4182]